MRFPFRFGLGFVVFSSFAWLAGCAGDDVATHDQELSEGTESATSAKEADEPVLDTGGKPATCLAMPLCDPGDTTLASASACPPSPEICYARTTCGRTVYCAGHVAARARLK